MKRRYDSDLKLIKKSERRVLFSIIGVVIASLAFLLALFWLFTLSWFSHSDLFEKAYMVTVLIETILLMILAVLLYKRVKSARVCVSIFGVAQFFVSALLVYQAWKSQGQWLAWLVWGIGMFLYGMGLLDYAGWLRRGFWPKIYFDRIVIRDPGDQDAGYQEDDYYQRPARQIVEQPASSPVQRPSTTASTQPKRVHPSTPAPVVNSSSRESDVIYTTPERVEPAKDTMAVYPRMAIRIGVVVYLEMIVFPIVINLFPSLFLSDDKKQSFASPMMFSLCIISAVVWTVAIYFLYLKQPDFKKALQICLGIEIVSLAVSTFLLCRYATGSDVVYRWPAILAFTILDAVRLGILLWGVLPAFKLPPIDKGSKDSDDDWKAGYRIVLEEEDFDNDSQDDFEEEESDGELPY